MKKKLSELLLLFMIAFTMIGCGEKGITVQFDTDGGSPVADIVLDKEGNIGIPTEIPEKEGYVFLHWELKGKEFDFSTLIRKDIVLKAVWKLNPVRLEAPKNVVLTEDMLTWDPVENADEYEVRVNDEEPLTVKEPKSKITLSDDASTISVIAKSKKPYFEASPEATIMISKELGLDELSKILGKSPEELQEVSEEIRKNLNELALIYKQFGYKADMDLKKEILEKIKEGKASKPLGYALMYAVTSAPSGLKEIFTEIPEMSEDTKEGLQNLYEKLKSENAYTSEYTDFASDKKFTELVAPVLSKAIFDSYGDIEPVIMTTLYFQDVKREGKTFIFENEITKSKHQMTMDEVNKLVQFYDRSHYDWGYERAICDAHEFYRKQCYKLMVEEVIEKLKNSKAGLMGFATKELPKLDELIKRGYENYEQFEKISFSEFDEKMSEGKTDEAAALVKPNIDSVIELLLNTLPTQEEVAVLSEFLKVMDLGAVMMMILNTEDVHRLPYFIAYAEPFTIDAKEADLIGELLNYLFDQVKTILAAAEVFTVDDYKAILDAVESNGEDLEPLKAVFDKLIAEMTIKEEGKELKLPNSAAETGEKFVFKLLDAFGVDIKSILSIAMEFEFNEADKEILDFFEEDLRAYLEKMPEWGEIDLTQLVTIVNGGSFKKLPEEFQAKIFEFIDYVLDYFNKEKVQKVEKYIKSLLVYLLPMYEEKIDELYNLLPENIELIRDYGKAIAKVQLILDRSYDISGEDGVAILNSQLDIIDKVLKDGNAEKLAQLLTDLNELIPIDMEEIFFVKDYDRKMAALKAATEKSKESLTAEEKELIESAEETFGLRWYYRDSLYLVVSEETKEFVIKALPDVSSKYASLKSVEVSYNDPIVYVYYEPVNYTKGSNLEICRIKFADIRSIIEAAYQKAGMTFDPNYVAPMRFPMRLYLEFEGEGGCYCISLNADQKRLIAG